MSIFMLIRHADNDWVGKTLAGWTPGVHLNGIGRIQAERLAEHLGKSGIARMFSSPLDRATETAEPLARRLGVKIEIREAFGEVRTGEWTGHAIAELERDQRWRHFNSYRSGTRIPGGELMPEVQTRAVCEIETLRDEFPDDVLCVVSH